MNAASCDPFEQMRYFFPLWAVMQKSHDTVLNPADWLDRHGDYLFRYALSRLRDPEASEEVVQETFLAGYQHRDQYSGGGTERAWLLGILKRKIIDHVRRRNRGDVGEGADEGDDLAERLFDQKGGWKADPRLFGTDPSASMERQDFWRVLRACLETLPQKQADAFTLRELDERTSQEICKDLQITSSNLWVLLHRARLGLASCIQSRWGDESE